MATYITDTVKDTIKRFAFGYVFTAKDFALPVEKQKTINKLLDNMVAVGQIRRLSKGRFYKPEMSNFGELPPDTYQMVKDLIEKNGKITGYLTGYSVFNKFGLTTQNPITLQIATSKAKKAVIRGNYRISFVIQPNTITKESISILQLLDCLRFFKEIPDTMPNEACIRLIFLFKQLTDKQINSAKRLVLKYNPATIALLGALFETLNMDEDTSTLFNALNHQSSYSFGISTDILPNQKKWHIR
jgi:hypothetical protein